MNPSTKNATAVVLGVAIEPLNLEYAIDRIRTELEKNSKGYVCFVGVHGVMEAHRDPELAAIYADATITVPDGTPTVWVGRLQGQKQMRRVAGPELMIALLSRPELARYTHFLYGGKQNVAEELRAGLTARFPWIDIVGTYTPPFRDLTREEERDLFATVNKLKPDIIWVGISTPKQERFMHRYLDQLDTKLMFGVGAAFDYHTGRIKDSPQWVKTIGMQWTHRLLQDPRHLWRRYLRNNPAFLWHIGLQLTGLRSYPAAQPTLGFRPALHPRPLSDPQ